MTREQAREYINSRLPYELTKAAKTVNGADTYICPICSNGSGEDGDGICTLNGKHYKCFRCDFYGDYLDMLKELNGTTRETDIFTMYSLKIDYQPVEVVVDKIEDDNFTKDFIEKKHLDINYTQYYENCNTQADQTDYFSKRGISKETVDRSKSGFDSVWKHPNTPNAPETERVIIPVSKSSYVARATDPNNSYKIQKVGASCLYNVKALQCKSAPYIFIVEGEFDALSVIEAGGQAVGLGSTSNVNKLIQAVSENPPTATLVLALDNDEAGQKAQAVLKERLETLNIKFIESNISGAFSDPNEALINDRDGFIKRIKDPANHGDKKIEYAKSYSVSGGLDDFMRAVSAPTAKAIPTGFGILDKALDGGFYEGLYILGAVSGIGKTSICLQIADQVAECDRDVIIFSLEMSKYTLISKSLSRLTFIEDNKKDPKGFFHARTSRQISIGAFYNDTEKSLIENALSNYRKSSQHLYIYDSMSGIGAAKIQQVVNEHIDLTGSRPLVIVDYLQILTPNEPAAGTKQNIDNAVLELKQMSMKHKIPVLAVSSFNRDNYLNPVSMVSFKESGAIEYSSDVLLGLQFKGMNELHQNKSGDTMKIIADWQCAECRELELKIIKNRNGASGGSVLIQYYPMFNYFNEKGGVNND
jgi:replicative DNA helicase